ncbi:MAG: DMT family transporter [Betaproteobacteria bacterium]
MRTVPALFGLHAAVLLFGVAGLFGDWLALPPSTIVLGRSAVAAATLALVAVAARTLTRPTTALAFNGTVLALHWVAFFAAIQTASVAVGLIGYASFPLWTLAIERLAGERRPSRRDAAISVLVVAGLLLTVRRFDVDDAVLRGLAWGVLSGATFAWLAVRNRRLARAHRPQPIALWQNAFAALCLVPVVLLLDRPDAWPSPRDLMLIAILGVACTALAHTLFVAALATVSAHTASVVAALEPVYGIALAAALLGERPTPGMLAGCGLLVVAALIASRGAGRSDAAGRMRD